MQSDFSVKCHPIMSLPLSDDGRCLVGPDSRVSAVFAGHEYVHELYDHYQVIRGLFMLRDHYLDHGIIDQSFVIIILIIDFSTNHS